MQTHFHPRHTIIKMDITVAGSMNASS